MKLLKKARWIDVKIAYLMAHQLRLHGIGTKHDTAIPTPSEYKIAQKKALAELKKLSEAKLDELMLEKNRKTYAKRFHEMRLRRLNSYNDAKWFTANVSTKELGVWRGAGGLPISWTKEPLDKLAARVKKGLTTNSRHIKKRSRRSIPAILALKNILKKDKYSLPIVFESRQGTNGRKSLPKTKFDIDDGNMRAIAYAASGDKTVKVYIGILSKVTL